MKDTKYRVSTKLVFLFSLTTEILKESGWQNWLGPPSLQFSWPVLGGCKMTLPFQILCTYQVRRGRGSLRILHLFYQEKKSIAYNPTRSSLPSYRPVLSVDHLSTPRSKEGDRAGGVWEWLLGKLKPQRLSHPTFWASHKLSETCVTQGR